MAACCVSACKNRYSSTAKLKFYRIPSPCRRYPSLADRRRLWLKAIQEANGSVLRLSPDVRICGAHFISGKASTDEDDPDFVPSVFPSMNPNQDAAKTVERTGAAEVRRVEETGPPPDDHFSDLKGETQTSPSSPVPTEEEETLTEEEEDESEIHPRVWSQDSKGSSNLRAKIPALCLRPVFAPLAGYLCELCDQTFSQASELVKHKQRHENPTSCRANESVFLKREGLPQRVPAPSFPCNMCDRSFTTHQSLKRHKLLHVKDGRRCPKCGRIFCRLHNHILFMPPPKSEQSSAAEASSRQDARQSDGSSSGESFAGQPGVKQNSSEDAPPLEESGPESESSAAVAEPGPLSETQNPLPPASHFRMWQEVPLPKLRRVSNPQAARCFRDDYPADYTQLHLPRQPRLQPPLRVFSPQRLTSALLEVRRNYEYILGKALNVEESQSRYTAYDLEVVLPSSP